MPNPRSHRMRFLRDFGCVGTTMFVLGTSCVLAQGFPSKPIRVVVPFPPGGVDVTIRMMQKVMSEELGQPIVIDNRPGANGFIGSELVARAAPDGYTLLAPSSSTFVAGVLVSSNVPFDVVRDFTPVTMIMSTVSTLVVKPSLPVSSVRELIDLAKRNPGKISYASTGIGSVQHLDGEYFKITAGVNLNHIPYKGFGPVVQAMFAQEVDVAFLTVQAASPLLSSGKAKPLAVYNGRRPPALPDTPQLTDTVPGFHAAPGWIGLFGPAALLGAVLTRLNSAAVKSLASPDVRAKLAQSGATVIANTPAEFSAELKAGLENTAKVVSALKSIGVKFEE